MNETGTGALIRRLRRELGLTQAQLALRLSVSDRAVSKWERGLGLPDTGLLPALSRELGVSAERLLAGSLQQNRNDGGSMKRIRFYQCPFCGNLLTAAGTAEVSCCGRRLAPLIPRDPDPDHLPAVEPMDGEQYLTLSHEMTKNHFLRFAAVLGYDSVFLKRLYPEQDPAFRLPILPGGQVFLCCSEHGLFRLGPQRTLGK